LDQHLRASLAFSSDSSGSVIGSGELLYAVTEGVLSLDFQFSNYKMKLNQPSSRTMALGSTQPLTEMSTRNLSGGKGWPAHGADNLTAICEPIV
jgi:hypothetical protein